MDIWLIVLLVVLGLLVIVFGMGFYAHGMLFNHRFKIDPDVEVYTKEMFGLDAKPMEFSVGKEKCRGYFYSKENYKKDVLIVYCHGMWATHQSYMQNIGFLANKGYEVLGFDYLGVDLSEGKNLKAFGNSLKCTDYALKHIKSLDEYKDRDIYVVGHSWGGYASSNIAYYHNDLKGVIGMSEVVSVKMLMKGLLPKWLWIFAYVVSIVDFLKGGNHSLRNVITSLKNYKGKVLFIHSTDDDVVKYEYSTGYLKKHIKQDNVKYYIVDNKKHQPHYTLESVKKMYDYNQKVKTLTPEEKVALKKKTNFLEHGVIDEVVMNQIVNLIESD